MMAHSILMWSVAAAEMMIVLAMACAAYRMLKGPRAQDRVLALDAFYVCGMILILTFGIETSDIFYFEAVLVIALVGFVATAALAKFLMRGEPIE
ncbi:Na(+) H(+) antiporter subunit F [Hyphomicrobium sulfonivorans]|uniref:Na(+) H(+) antiporter subunit F n=2 Tax=Hyphomicrobium sulfonivorans TaxID=121290 RepID=A0A120CY62_HYPSL|nr:Na(+) H(+) antiporter subunit F [Hyphomicrobium sulfonivorans]